MKTWFALIGICLLTASCGGSKQGNDDPASADQARGSYLPGSIGQQGEVVVVMPELQWQGAEGEAIRSLNEGPYFILPQPEELFSFTWQPQDFFYKFYKKHHSILWIEVGDNLNNLEARIMVEQDVYAEGQRIFKVYAKNGTELQKLLEEKGDRLLTLMNENAMERIQEQASINVSQTKRDSLESKLNLRLDIPRNFQLVADRPGFKWYRLIKSSANPQLDQGIFVYDYPYTEDSTFTPSFLIELRDSVLLEHVPGVTENSFMTTVALPGYEPSFEEISRNGQYAAVLRGLWAIDEDFRGGPFVSMTSLDEANNRVVTTDAYVYAPHEDKREHMRYMEGLLRSARIVD